jgi:hypothetical protein
MIRRTGKERLSIGSERTLRIYFLADSFSAAAV